MAEKASHALSAEELAAWREKAAAKIATQTTEAKTKPSVEEESKKTKEKEEEKHDKPKIVPPSHIGKDEIWVHVTVETGSIMLDTPDRFSPKGDADPYCEVRWGDESYGKGDHHVGTTPTAPRTLSPIWNKSWQFTAHIAELYYLSKSVYLHFVVYQNTGTLVPGFLDTEIGRGYLQLREGENSETVSIQSEDGKWTFGGVLVTTHVKRYNGPQLQAERTSLLDVA